MAASCIDLALAGSEGGHFGHCASRCPAHHRLPVERCGGGLRYPADQATGYREGGSAASRDEVRTRALAEGATVYTVFFRGSLLHRLWDGGCPSAGRCQNQREVLVLNIEPPGTYLEPLSEATGGRLLTIEDDEDISTSMSAFVDELRHQYLLGVPAGRRDGRTHRIRVQTVRTGLRVAARESYTAKAR